MLLTVNFLHSVSVLNLYCFLGVSFSFLHFINKNQSIYLHDKLYLKIRMRVYKQINEI
jgi:hypothetical protein